MPYTQDKPLIVNYLLKQSILTNKLVDFPTHLIPYPANFIPFFKDDLLDYESVLIIESAFLENNSMDILELKAQVSKVIVIMSNSNANYVDYLYSIGINDVLRTDFTKSELIFLLSEFAQGHAIYIEKNILQSIYDKAQNSIVITDLSGNILFANEYFQKATEYTQDELRGNSPKILKSGIHDSLFYKELWDTIESGLVWNGVFVNKSKSGILFYEEATISPIRNIHGLVERYLKIGRKVPREHLLLTELSTEVKSAKEVLVSMLSVPYSDLYIDFTSQIKAYNYLGGDYIFFNKTVDTTYRTAFIDVMGHGLSAAILGLKMITIFQELSNLQSIETTVQKINDTLIQYNMENSGSSKYISGVFLEFDTKSKTLRYISAGHPDFYLIDQNNDVTPFHSNHLLLGVIPNYDYTFDQVSINNVTNVFIYSDGLTELHDDLSQSECELIQILKDSMNSLPDIFNEILNKMVGNSPIKDDIALCKITLK